MFKFVLRVLAVLICVFILPGLLHLGYWMTNERPGSWRQADWSSAGVLPAPTRNEAAIYILAARTGGVKGAFATHSWIVLKKPGQHNYDRYDVVGWGKPVRKNAYDPDGRWYSNAPVIHYEAHGTKAARMIGSVEKAISNYRWKNYGDYTIWPGPNSNTFVASIVRAVPDLDANMPSTAVGRDFPEDGKWLNWTKTGALRASLGGYAGFVVGRREGFEVNFLGLVAGFNLFERQIKIPAFGTVSL